MDRDKFQRMIDGILAEPTTGELLDVLEQLAAYCDEQAEIDGPGWHRAKFLILLLHDALDKDPEKY